MLKLYYITWRNCINRKQFVVFNAQSKEERDAIFDQWRKDNPNDAPSAYYPRELKLQNGTCAYLNNLG